MDFKSKSVLSSFLHSQCMGWGCLICSGLALQKLTLALEVSHQPDRPWSPGFQMTSHGVPLHPKSKLSKNVPAADGLITKLLKALLVNKSIYQLIICNKLMQLPAEPLTVIVFTICLLKYHSSSAIRSRREDFSTATPNFKLMNNRSAFCAFIPTCVSSVLH